MTDTSFNKLLDPVSDIITSMESIVSGAFGITTGDQRESYKRIHAYCWGIHTLVMDIVTSLGLEHIATHPEVNDRFHSLIRPIKTNMRDLIQGYDGELSEEQILIIEYVETAINSIEHMMSNLWHYSLIKHDKINYTPSEFDMTILLHNVKTVLVDYDVPDFVLPCRIIGDETYLKYAFSEVAYNVKHHAYVDSVNIEAQIYPNRADLTIHDTGYGFNCENMNSPFQPFWQSAESNDGFGLGLYLARSFIEGSRGTISISSEQQGGTLVKISLPLA
jgi:signal transduction histidine kinase